MKSKPSAAGDAAAEPPTILQPFSLGRRAASSFWDMGIERRYFPGTVFPERTTLTAASGILAPLRIMSMVRYSTLSAPASSAAPAMARDIGEMYGGTPSAAGSSMYPSMRRMEISLPMAGGLVRPLKCDAGPQASDFSFLKTQYLLSTQLRAISTKLVMSLVTYPSDPRMPKSSSVSMWTPISVPR